MGQLVRAADYIQTLGQMEGSGLSVLQPAVIVNAIGHIAALLRLNQQCPSLNGMNRSRFNLEKISAMDGVGFQKLLPAPFLNHLL